MAERTWSVEVSSAPPSRVTLDMCPSEADYLGRDSKGLGLGVPWAPCDVHSRQGRAGVVDLPEGGGMNSKRGADDLPSPEDAASDSGKWAQWGHLLRALGSLSLASVLPMSDTPRLKGLLSGLSNHSPSRPSLPMPFSARGHAYKTCAV